MNGDELAGGIERELVAHRTTIYDAGWRLDCAELPGGTMALLVLDSEAETLHVPIGLLDARALGRKLLGLGIVTL